VLNGKEIRLQSSPPLVISRLIEERRLNPERIALALNGQVIPREQWPGTPLQEGDEVDIVHAVGGGTDAPSPVAETAFPELQDDPLVIAGEVFQSRLFLGTGKFPDTASMVESLK